MLLLLLRKAFGLTVVPPPATIPTPPAEGTPLPQTPDVTAMVARLDALLPKRWFPAGEAPYKDALLVGFANCFVFLKSLLDYVRLQTRIATATDGWLDLIAFDFFGTKVARSAGQSDASFRRQIIAYLLRHRNTRAAIIAAIQGLLGTTPTVIEPQRVTDTGAYDEPSTLGYDVAGVYGDSGMPLQCFVDITIPTSLQIGPPLIVGWDVPGAGYDTGSQIEYVGPPSLDPVEIADIYAALDAVRPVTGVIWAQIRAA